MASEPMTDEELDAIEARAKKATLAPWVARLMGTMGDVIADYEDNAMIEEITPNIDANDAAFIAHARDDVPALVAEVRRLRRYSASGTEHRAKAADALQQASGGYFVSSLNRKEVEEVVAVVDNVLLQERRT